jgi:hypothetical protein
MNVKEEAKAVSRLIRTLNFKETFTDAYLMTLLYGLRTLEIEIYEETNKIINLFYEYKKQQKELLEALYEILSSYENYKEAVIEQYLEDLRKILDEFLETINKPLVEYIVFEKQQIESREYVIDYTFKEDYLENINTDAYKERLMHVLTELKSILESVNEAIPYVLYRDVYSDYYIVEVIKKIKKYMILSKELKKFI